MNKHKFHAIALCTSLLAKISLWHFSKGRKGRITADAVSGEDFSLRMKEIAAFVCQVSHKPIDLNKLAIFLHLSGYSYRSTLGLFK